MASKIYNQSNMSTADVKKMQQALVDAGYSVGSSGVDGVWGKDTAAALSQFKKDTGGSNTYGTTVGNETFNKLYGTGGSSGGSTGGSTTPSASKGSNPLTGLGFVSQIANLVAKTPEAQQGIMAYQNLNNAYDQQFETLNTGYENYVTELESGANNANAALDNARKNALAGIESTYNDSARNYYRLYRSQEKELPEQLSSIGATGGATESAALRLMNAYSDNLYKNETARNQDVNALNEDYYSAVANNSKQLASQLASAYLQLSQQQAELQGQQYADRQNLINNYVSQYQQREQDKADKSLAAANATTDAQIAALKAAGNKVYTYTDADGYKRYTVGESKSGSGKSKDETDPDANAASKSLLSQYIRNAGGIMYGNSSYAMRTNGADDTVTYIQKLYNNEKISENQANSLLKQLGLK